MGLFNLFKSKEEREKERIEREERSKINIEREKKIAEISDQIYYECVIGCKNKHTNVYYRNISSLEPEVKKEIFSNLLLWFNFDYDYREYLEEFDFVVNNKAKEHPNAQKIYCLRRMTKKEYEFYEKYINIDCDADENDPEWAYLKDAPKDMEYMYNYCSYNDHYIIEYEDIGFEYRYDGGYIKILGISNNYITYIVESDDYDEYRKSKIDKYDRSGLLMNR